MGEPERESRRKRLTRRLDSALRSEETARLASGAEDLLSEARHDRKQDKGTFRGLQITVHRGYVANDVAKVHVRVSEAPAESEPSRIPYWGALKTNLRRHAALAVPDLRFDVTIAGVTVAAVTDRRGMAAVSVPVTADLPPGWHDVLVVAQSPSTDEAGAAEDESGAGTLANAMFQGRGQVLKPDPAIAVGVISDIDDTILRTGMTDALAALSRTLLREASGRAAIPGMAPLYRGLARGSGSDALDEPSRPVFYLSAGSWSFYDMLIEFQQAQGFPSGPLFLTDWGPNEDRLTRSGRAHKRQALRRMLDSYPSMSFVLIGDSGEADPVVYAELAREVPERVRSIVIVLVDPADVDRRDEVAAISEDVTAAGVPMVLTRDAAEAAEHLSRMGLCDPATVAQVREQLQARS